MDRKLLPLEIKELGPSADGQGWEIAGYASTFGGEPDSYGDVVAAGAFASSIATRPTKLLLQHETPIGYQLELREDAHGLWGRWALIDTSAGTDAYKLAKAGVLDSLSIGYVPTDSEYRADGVRVLKAVDLLEVSLVTFPANSAAVVTDVKARPFTEHSEHVRVAVTEWLARVEAGSALRAKSDRPLSDERRAALEAMSGSLKAAAERVDRLLAPSASRVFAGAELRRRRLQAAGLLGDRS